MVLAWKFIVCLVRGDFDTADTRAWRRHIRGGWLASAGTVCARREGASRTIYALPSRTTAGVPRDDRLGRSPVKIRSAAKTHVARPPPGEEVGALTADDVHLTRSLLTLDDKGHRELSELLLDVVLKALEIEAESLARLDGAAGRRTELGVLHFDTTPDG